MLEVDHVAGAYAVPQDLKEALVTIGGKNPYGEPIWRLALAQNVYRRRAGVRKIWDENLSVAERGGIDMSTGEQFDNKPIRVETGMYEGRKYPNVEGWILERWYDAHYFSRELWFSEQFVLADGTPKLGPYPECGMYRMIYGPYTYLPTVGQLQQWIRAHYRTIESRPSNPAQLVIEEVNAYHEAEEREWKDLCTQLDAMVNDRLIDENRVSLAAGRHREELAQRIRQKYGINLGHVGN